MPGLVAEAARADCEVGAGLVALLGLPTIDEIVGFLAASMELSAGTLRPVPQRVPAERRRPVAVLTRISGERPDGRTLDDTQILYFQLEDGKVRSVDQFIGDPPAVTELWA